MSEETPKTEGEQKAFDFDSVNVSELSVDAQIIFEAEKQAAERLAAQAAENKEAETTTASAETQAAETTTEAAPEAPKSLFDIIDTPTETKPTFELPEEAKGYVAELEQKAKEAAEKLEALQKELTEKAESPIFKLLNSKLTKEQIQEKLKTVDYSKVPTEELITQKVTEAFKGDEDLQSKIEAEIAAYESKSPLEKMAYDKAIKAEFNSKATNEEGWKEIEAAYQEQAEKLAKIPTPEQQQQQIQSIVNEDISAIDATIKGLKDKGFDFPEDMAKAIKDSYSFDMSAGFTKDNKFNAVEFIKDRYKVLDYDKLRERHKDELAKAIDEAEKRGEERAKKKYANPDQAGGGSGNQVARSANDEYMAVIKG